MGKYTKVKLTFPPKVWDAFRQTPDSSGIWGNYQYFLNDDLEECDYWVVVGFLNNKVETAILCKENVCLFTLEHKEVIDYKQSFLDQFNQIFTDRIEIFHSNKYFAPRLFPWFHKKTYDELIKDNPIKNKSLSIISSNKSLLKGHKARLDFVKKIKNYFGNSVDLFGRGFNEFDNKYDVLAPYYFSIAIENHTAKNHFSEKLLDCFLTETIPLYYNCPNITDYFPSNSLINIDIHEFDNAVKIIKKILDNPAVEYSKRYEQLRISKFLALNKYNLFAIISDNLDRLPKSCSGTKKKIRLYNNFKKIKINNLYIFVKNHIKKINNSY